MANRANNQQASAPSSVSGTPQPTPPALLRNFHTTPATQPFIGRGGLAAKRNRPNFNIRDIIGPEGTGGGASNAGLGMGIPQSQREETPLRRPPAVTGSPFSNFDKIVYVLVT